MRRSAVLGVLVAFAAGVAIAGFSSASGQAPQVTWTKQTFTAKEKDTNDFGFLDAAPKTKFGKNGPRHLSPGDQMAFHSLIVQDGKTVGGLHAKCTVTHGGTFETASADCTGTFNLPGGTLFAGVGGPKVFGSKTITGAITGGTGAYEGATGSFSSPQQTNTTDTFTIYVPSGG